MSDTPQNKFSDYVEKLSRANIEIATLKAELAAKDEQIEARDKHIASLKDQIGARVDEHEGLRELAVEVKRVMQDKGVWAVERHEACAIELTYSHWMFMRNLAKAALKKLEGR